MDKNNEESFFPIFDSYNIINLEQIEKFPYCFLGLVFTQNKTNIQTKSVGFIIGEDIIITHFQELNNENEIISFLPFTTGDFKLYNEPIKAIKHENILLDLGINSNPLYLVIAILERKIGKEIIDMLKLNSLPEFQININEKNRFFSFFKNHILFNENNKKMRMNGFWEKKLLLLTYIYPNKYFNNEYINSSNALLPDSLRITTTSTLTTLSLENKPISNLKSIFPILKNQFFLICDKKLRDKISDYSSSFFNNDKDCIISQIKKKLKRCENENIIQYEKINIMRGSPLFIETNFGLCLLGLTTKLAKKRENKDFSNLINDKEDSVGITLNLSLYNIINEKVNVMRHYIENNHIEMKYKFNFENLFLNFYEKNTLLVKGVFNKEILCEKLFDIAEKLIEISKIYLQLIIKDNDNNIVISNSNSNQQLSYFVEEKTKNYFDINIEINVNDISNIIIQSIKSSKEYIEALKSDKKIEMILKIVSSNIDLHNIKNEFLYSLIFNNIIQKIIQD